MMHEIDLHGMTHDEAVLETENFLLTESANNAYDSFECKIITGISPKLQIRIINEVLDKHNFTWVSPLYNSGCLIVSETFL